MYDRGTVRERLAAVSKQLGFGLTRHALVEVERANERLARIYDPDKGQPIRPLHPHERQWIQNERAYCMCDFLYWCRRYAFILTSDNRMVRFRPNVAQKIILDVWAELERNRRGIEIQEGKARQLGVSTLTELAVAHRVQFYANVNAVVASSDPSKSAKMAQMMERAWANQPWWLMPERTVDKAGELIEFGYQNSGVSIQHGAQVTGIARGDTPTVFHGSEMCDFQDPEELVDASLLPAMHPSPWLFLILESTAAGLHNWWQNSWEFNKENWASGRSRLRTIFLPWFVGTDVWPNASWVRDHPIPSDWKIPELIIKHAERAQAYVQQSDLLRKHLGSNWQMPREQMWFYEVTRGEYKAKYELPHFYAEFPASDIEMFQSPNLGVFEPDLIAEYNENTKPPKAVFGFTGNCIPLRIQPDRREIDVNQKPIRISRRLPQGGTFDCTLLPLRFQGYAETDFTNKLLVWEFAEAGYDYGIGVDTGDGIGQDRSVIEGVRKGDAQYNDRQICEFASAYVNAFDLAPLVYAVGCLYSPYPDYQAKMVIECNRSGQATQLEVRKMGWMNFHQWLPRYDKKRLSQARANYLGWETNARTRPLMMDNLIRMLRDGWIDVFSPWLVDEMRDLERDEVKQRLAACYNGHDDRIMAFGSVLWSLHALELQGTQRGMLFERMQRQGGDGGGTPIYPLYNPAAAYSRPIPLEEGAYLADGSPLVLPTEYDRR